MNSASHQPSRRDAIRMGVSAGIGLALGRPSFAAQLEQALQQLQLPVITRAIPASSERIPIVGLSTNQFDVNTPKQIAPLCAVLRKFSELNGKVVDTARQYGRAEEVIGECVKEIGSRDKLFIATRFSVTAPSRGRGRGNAAPPDPKAGLDQAFTRLKTDRIDLLMVHNLSGTDVLLPLIREHRQAGRVRYVGVSATSDNQYDALMQLMRNEPLDFIQVDYAINNRSAAKSVLPLAQEKKIGVLLSQPLGRTSALARVRGRPLPDWAREMDATTWTQIFLKYVVSHPAATVAVPATARVEQLIEYNGAARGRLPDEVMRRTIEQYYDAL